MNILLDVSVGNFFSHTSKTRLQYISTCWSLKINCFSISMRKLAKEEYRKNVISKLKLWFIVITKIFKQLRIFFDWKNIMNCLACLLHGIQYYSFLKDPCLGPSINKHVIYKIMLNFKYKLRFSDNNSESKSIIQCLRNFFSLKL